MTDYWTIDFETARIENRPAYPPVPVGVAISHPAGQSCYLAWGHPIGNNTTLGIAREALEQVWDSGLPILMHNAKFDLAVAEEQLGLPPLPWDRIHDTQFLCFLNDPHAKLGLKQAAAHYLGMSTDEQEELHGWIWDHRAELEADYGIKILKKELGAWISLAPGELVAKYAIADVEMTAALFEHLYPLICEAGMEPAYNRERQFLPILMENERDGIRVDTEALERDLEDFEAEFMMAEEWLRQTLGVAELNLDADADVIEALSVSGLVDDDKWQRTRTGKRSIAKDSLTPDMFNDSRVPAALGYRNRLKTSMDMFMRPWLLQAQARGGVVSTHWNQVKDSRSGTCTGRPSTSNPNFLNIAKSFEDRSDGYLHPDFLPSAVADDAPITPLPLVRRYMLPDEGHTWVRRDFSAQEIRVLAHYESGELFDAFHADPLMSPHDWVKERVEEIMGMTIDKTKVKGLNFLAIYGGGIPAIMRTLGVSRVEAQRYKNFHDQALPGRRIVNDEITRRVRRGEPIYTWGGRRYYVQPPVGDQSFEYRLINYLCQGSAADLTKQAIIDWHAAKDADTRFLLTVYDELNISVPNDKVDAEMTVLRREMDADRLSVPMRSEGETGPNWGDLETYND